jgi:hypothetical protein
MRKLLPILLLFIGPASVFSQDHIITKEGKDLTVTIQNIGETDVSFVLFNDTSKTQYLMEKKEIKKIIFANGTEESFADEKDETIIKNNATNKNKDPDKIYTTDGKVIYCEVVEKKRFGVNYIPAKSNDNYVEYLANTKIDRIEYANGEVEYISGTPDNPRKRKDAKDFSYLSPHYISINVGPAIPFGLLGTIAPQSSSIYTGVDVNIDANYYLFRGMGFGIMGGYMYNPFNGIQQASLAQSQVPGGATNVSITVDGWHNAYIMAGLGYYNEYRRFLLDYKGMFGAFFSFYPAAKATYTNNGVEQTSIYTDQSTSFIFGGQISARYFLTRKFQLKFNVGTLFGRANFQGLIRKDYQNGQQVSEQVAGTIAPVNLSWVNITVGVVYTLGK